MRADEALNMGMGAYEDCEWQEDEGTGAKAGSGEAEVEETEVTAATSPKEVTAATSPKEAARGADLPFARGHGAAGIASRYKTGPRLERYR